MSVIKRAWEKLKLLYPKNLAKEVHVYGYYFSWKAHLVWMLGALAGIGAVGVLFHLRPLQFSIVVGAVILVVPVLVLDMYRKMYEQKRFADAVSYMEQLLYSFQKTGKILSALKECRELFADGMMRECIDQAIFHIEFGRAESEQGILRESLQSVEKNYGCVKLSMVHGLLVNAEEYGGATGDAIVLALEDIERFKKRGYQLQAGKKKSHVDNVISIVVATLLCAVALYVLNSMKQMFVAGGSGDIFEISLIQITSVLFILVLLQIFVKSTRNLTDDWLTETMLHEPEYIMRSYDMVTTYDEGSARKKSFLLAGIPLLLAVVFLVLGRRLPAICSLVVMILLLVQHRVGYRLAQKDITEEMYLALPQWLFSMALLLQNNNVQVAITRSYEDAPAVLKKELALLMDRLSVMPGQLRTYTDFCKNFDLPEVASCMKMLHAFSENGTGNISVQMNHLLERVERMQDMADDIRNENIAFRMKLIFSYPMAAATIKLLADLTVGMIVMMQILGRIGGV